MKLLIALIFVCSTSLALTPYERRVVKQMQVEARQAKDRQQALQGDLTTQKSIVIAQAGEIERVEAQTKQVAKERDDWKTYGEGQHEKWINAETRVAKANGRVGWLVAASGLLLLICIGEAYLLFKP